MVLDIAIQAAGPWTGIPVDQASRVGEDRIIGTIQTTSVNDICHREKMSPILHLSPRPDRSLQGFQYPPLFGGYLFLCLCS
jgi:hypothetical protein